MSQSGRGKPKSKPGEKKERVFYYVSPNVSRPFDRCCRMLGKTPSEVLEQLERNFIARNNTPENLALFLANIDGDIKVMQGDLYELYNLRDDVVEKLGVKK